MLRAIFILAAIAIGLRYASRGPFYVLIFYLWIGYFRPEQWVWGDWLQSFPLSFAVGVFLLVSTLNSSERLRWGTGPFMLFAFLALTLVSMLLSPAINFPVWQKFAETITISYLFIVLVTTEQRLRATLMAIALSLGSEGAKQGWAQFFINPGGANDNTMPMLGDNNTVAVGMLMIVPVVLSLAATASRKLERYVERFVAVGVIYRALVTYSRGGFLSCAALAMHYLIRGKRKLVSALVIVAMAVVIAPVLPDAFWDRMNTIGTSTETKADDPGGSKASRQHFWDVAVVMANDNPILGVGFNAYNASYNRYDFSQGKFGWYRSVHSVWFGLMAEVGYTGLLLFAALFARASFTCWRTRRLAKAHPEFTNLASYATAVEAALLVVAVGGTFLPFQYNEMIWHFLALSMVIDNLTRAGMAKTLTA